MGMFMKIIYGGIELITKKVDALSTHPLYSILEIPTESNFIPSGNRIPTGGLEIFIPC